MSRKKGNTQLAKILRPELVSAEKQSPLEELVQQKVAEALVQKDGLLWEPWYRERAVANEIKKLQTVPEQRKWTAYFSIYGCFVCKKKTGMHAGNGCCTSCRSNRDIKIRRVARLLADGKA